MQEVLLGPLRGGRYKQVTAISSDRYSIFTVFDRLNRRNNTFIDSVVIIIKVLKCESNMSV